MATKFSLQINNPCSENWDKMTQESKGRLCASCSKVVVDFTTMSDNQIKEFFKNNSGQKVCGRVYIRQLERPYSYNNVYKRPWYASRFLQYALSGMLTLKLTDIAGSQSTAFQRENIVQVEKNNPANDFNQANSSNTKITRIIDGKVMSDNDTPVNGASVTINETGQTVQTNGAGKFSIQIPEGFKGNELTLVPSHPLYRGQEYKIDLRKGPVRNLTLQLIFNDHIKMGEMMVVPE